MAVPNKILQANKNVTLFGDILFMNQIPFFITVSDHLKFTTAEQIYTWIMAKMTTSIKHSKSIYSDCGFNVTKIITDGEFPPLKHTLASTGITLNIKAFKEHVPHIERQIRMIK